MPELPEVETVRRGLESRVLGRRIVAAEMLKAVVVQGSSRGFTSAIIGRTIVGVTRKGKVLALELGAGDGKVPTFLLVRLGMTGQFLIARRDAPLLAHTHVRLLLDGGGEELRYRDPRRFGSLRCSTREELDAFFRTLGPDAQQITEGQFRQAMRGRHATIKSWLINQRVLSGLGNIYADEALFRARIHPLAQAGRLSAARAHRLYLAVRWVMAQAVARQGTTFRDYIDVEGRPGEYRVRLRAYQRAGKPCYRCGGKIRRLVIAGRSSHFCPRCQRVPAYVQCNVRIRAPRSWL